MLATQLKYEMMPAVYEQGIRQSTLLVHKTMPLLREGNIAARKVNKALPVFSSLGLAIPFQPSMWDEKSIEAAWKNTIQIVQAKINGRYSAECTGKVITRLGKLFVKLNFNTHQKSLAVILTPDEEKLFYLSYPVKPVVFSGSSVSLLHLAANLQEEAGFYYFVLNNNSASLYDYNNKQLLKVYEQNNETNAGKLYKNATAIIQLLNSKNEKPVFVTGSPNLVENFCISGYYRANYFTMLYDIAPYSTEIIRSIVKEITMHWGYWQSKFTAGRVLLAQKANALVSNIEAVLQALRKSTDGLLLIDKRLKRQLQNPNINISCNTFFKIADELLHQIEKFLGRGNRIEITETGLLKGLGGIVLLSNIAPGNSHTALYTRQSESGIRGELF